MVPVADPTVLTRIFKQYGAVKQPEPAKTPPISRAPFAVGQSVRLKTGAQVQVTKVHPDGTFDADPHKVEQSDPTANYMGPKEGPFRCDHCEYFQKPRACAKVAGTIAPAGCCNLFEAS